MGFLALAKRRCSVRAYQDKPVEEDKLMAILEAARVAPTACNRQPFRLLVVQSVEGRAQLDKAARLYGAPVVIIVCADTDTVWTRPLDGMQSCEIDASIITDHLMLAAADLELGSVWICSLDSQIIRDAFALPVNLVPINLLALGYPDGALKDPDRHQEDRKSLDELVSFETL